MTKTRLEAFSDAVIAVLMTILVLELKAPHGDDLHALLPLCITFSSYVLSFVYIGIYWNNHHHMLHAARGVDGHVLWTNLHLLFWLSLVPFTTAWMGESRVAPIPTAAYGLVLLAAGLAYLLLQHAIIRHDGERSELRDAVGGDWKGKVSLLAYVAAFGIAFLQPWASMAIYAAVAAIWFVPDRRIERRAHEGGADPTR